MNNLLDIYLRDISRYHPLTPEQELTIATRARQGDSEAREQLIHAHLPLVVRVAKIYMPPLRRDHGPHPGRQYRTNLCRG